MITVFYIHWDRFSWMQVFLISWMRRLSVSVTKLFLYSSKMQILGEEGGKISKFTTKIDNWPIMNSNDFTVLKLQCDSIVLTLDNDNRNKIINKIFDTRKVHESIIPSHHFSVYKWLKLIWNSVWMQIHTKFECHMIIFKK